MLGGRAPQSCYISNKKQQHYHHDFRVRTLFFALKMITPFVFKSATSEIWLQLPKMVLIQWEQSLALFSLSLDKSCPCRRGSFLGQHCYPRLIALNGITDLISFPSPVSKSSRQDHIKCWSLYHLWIRGAEWNSVLHFHGTETRIGFQLSGSTELPQTCSTHKAKLHPLGKLEL